MMAETTEADLIAAASGDAPAFARLVAAHEDAVYRLMLGQTGGAADAHDLTQETFLRAFRHAERLREVRSPRAWFSRIALNVARDWRRRRFVRRLVGLAADRPGDEVLAVRVDEPEIERVLDARATLADAWRQIALLPRSLREPLVLCAVEGLSQAEAAEVLGISAKAVEMRVRRGRQQLAARIRPENR
ncbi:RNA polymerase sigma factor [Sphingomonas rubra]|uniref:RNA polymerase sigma-70 factor, ECF subfamily n=1 Tax=Sphingomonas rubra TaxID=634430 RepID=A0A1I5SGI6_9SPHN|nr:RNA polymerase sigma factor [Sphingomonas rubra]SFP69840.1 RNA polymerase sigma-70 factor, ECF subfamily [Sphingomonas rubra]